MAKIYLYLARRDRKGLKIVSVLDGPNTPAIRLQDVKLLNLPQNMEGEVGRIIYDNRMYWEAWLESADSYEELKKAARNRGYRGVPSHSNSMYLGDKLQHKVNVPFVKPAETMIRKA